MSTTGQSGKVTLLDWAKSVDPLGQIAAVAELLSQSNQILTDMRWIEGNLPTGHKSAVRTGIPAATWRQLYQGVQPTKSSRAMVEDSIGMLEMRCEVDKALADLNGTSSAFRASEAMASGEGMNQTMADTFIYGNTATTPERFMGLAPRFNAISGAANAQNMISASGSGSVNTSVWLVGWGEQSVHGIFPKGSPSGLQHEDLGVIDAFDTATPAGRYRAYADHWVWKAGLVVKDWRYIVRICNIDVTDLTTQATTQASTASTLLIKLMVKALSRFPAEGVATPVFYCNRTVKEYLSIQAMDKASSVLKFSDGINQFGNVGPGSVAAGTLTFQGVPVRTVDRILSTEATIT